MMKKRKYGNGGMAALFDSLMFLAVVSIVSIVLLSSASPRPEVPDGKGAEELDAVHEVLLRCTVPVSQGKNASLMESAVQSGVLTPDVERMISSTLDELLPLMSWRWTFDSSLGTNVLGGEVPAGKDVYASKVTVADGDFTFTLQAWRQ
jgi:hypothetical protein